MAHRYAARRQDDAKYCIWDHQTNAVALAPNGDAFGNLGFDAAIEITEALNASDKAPSGEN